MEKKKRKEWIRSYAWSAPSLLLIGLMVVFPILYTFYISLTNMNVYHWFDFTLVGLDNYIRALFVFDSGFLSALLATILWTAVSMILQLVIAFLLANLLNIEKLRLRKLYKTVLMFPWAMPGYVGILLWKTGMFATTEELYAYMENNTGRGRYGFVEQHSTAYYSAAWIHGFGGSIIDSSGTPFPDAQAVQDALAYHLKFVKLMPGETEYNTVNTLFLEGKADATIGGPWMVPSAREAGIDLGIAPMPTVDETGLALAPYSGVQGVHVLKAAAERKTAAVKQLLAALAKPEIGTSLALASGCAPANGNCYDDARVAEDALVQAMRQTAEIAVPMPNIPEMDVMWTVVSSLLTDVNLSGKDIPSSFQSAKEQAESLIAGMK